MTLPKVLVAGSTGYLGRHVVRALHAAGHPVRALARSEERLGDVRPLCSEVFVGEATRPETLRGVMGDARVVFSSLGKHDFKRTPTTWEVDRDANLHLVRAAKEAGVEHFVFISVLHGERLRAEGVGVAEARESVVDALRSSGLGWTVLRPSGFFNDMQDFFRMAEKGTGWLLGDGSFRMSPIHGADLATEVVRCIADPKARMKSFDVGGPDALTYRQILELAFTSLGKPPKLRSIPTGTLRAIAPVVRLFNPFVAELIRSMYFLAKWEGIAPPTGTHTLSAFFAELAEQHRYAAR